MRNLMAETGGLKILQHLYEACQRTNHARGVYAASSTDGEGILVISFMGTTFAA